MSEHHAPVEASTRARIGIDAFRSRSTSGSLGQHSDPKRCHPRLAIQTESPVSQQATNLRHHLADATIFTNPSGADLTPARNGS